MEVFAEKLSEAVKVMADKLGVAAEKLYPILIKQAYVEGYINLFYAIMCLLLALVVILIVKHLLKKRNMYKQTNKYNSEDDTYAYGALFASFIATILIVITAGCANWAVRALYNPEWYAIKMILDLVK